MPVRRPLVGDGVAKDEFVLFAFLFRADRPDFLGAERSINQVIFEVTQGGSKFKCLYFSKRWTMSS
jgi:hypothetical protein